jgi:hypothetical protein
MPYAPRSQPDASAGNDEGLRLFYTELAPSWLPVKKIKRYFETENGIVCLLCRMPHSDSPELRNSRAAPRGRQLPNRSSARRGDRHGSSRSRSRSRPMKRHVRSRSSSSSSSSSAAERPWRNPSETRTNPPEGNLEMITIMPVFVEMIAFHYDLLQAGDRRPVVRRPLPLNHPCGVVQL